MLFGKLVKPFRICLEKACHLVDKRACTACTYTVHTLFNITAFKIYNLGIFAAKLDCYVCFGNYLFNGIGCCNNLLYKRNIHCLGKRNAAASAYSFSSTGWPGCSVRAPPPVTSSTAMA